MQRLERGDNPLQINTVVLCGGCSVRRSPVRGLLLAFSPCSGVDHLVGAPCFEIGLDLHSMPSCICVDGIGDVAVLHDTCANDKSPALWRRLSNRNDEMLVAKKLCQEMSGYC